MKSKLFIGRCCLVFTALAILILKVQFFSTANSAIKEGKLSCGVRCLLIIFNKFGIKTPPDELIKISGYRKNRGTTMYGLYKAAREKGLYAVGMKIGIEDLSKLKIPAIVHLWNNHFVVVEPVEYNRLKITDSSQKTEIISTEKFKSYYSGFALLISPDRIDFSKIEQKEVPDIRFNEYIYNFGEVEQGKKVLFKFHFRNVGRKVLKISKVRSTCGCIVGNLTKTEFLPGEKGTITGVFNTYGRRGLQIETIYVHTNDPVMSLIPLKIQGFVNPGVFIVPEIVRFGEIEKGETKEKEIYLVNLTKKRVKINRIQSELPYIAWKISKSDSRSRPGYKIKFFLSPEAPSGEFDGNIVISTNNKKHSKFNIPVVGKVKGDIEIYPELVFFYGEIGNLKEQKIFLQTENLSRVKKIETSSPFVKAIPLEKKNKYYKLLCSVDKNFESKYLKEKIIVYMDKQRIVEIPVYGIIIGGR